MPRPLFAFKAFSVLLLGQALSVPASLAADWRVTVAEDQFDGVCNAHCSLRDAVQATNAHAGADRILLNATAVLSRPAASQDGSTLDEDDNQSGDLDIRDELIIRGQGSDKTAIEALPALGDRLLEVRPGARLTLERLRLSGGFTSAYGGALENHGESRLSQVLLSDNQASSSNDDLGSGGAIANYGTLSLFSSTLLRNSAFGGQSEDGRGVGGHGGALYNSGQLLVRDSLFEGNRVSSLSDEGFGGALHNRGLADIARSTFIKNWAAPFAKASGIHNQGAGVVQVSNSTFSANVMDGPSGVITNEAPNLAGTPEVRLINVTIADNLGNGVYNGGKLRIRNSIIAGNSDGWGGYADNCLNFGLAPSYQALGLVLGTGAGSCTAELYIDNGQTLTQLLEPLSVHAQRTQVHALRPGSVALDAGLGSCTRHDQRRQPRPLDGDGDGVAICDLGAYER